MALLPRDAAFGALNRYDQRKRDPVNTSSLNRVTRAGIALALVLTVGLLAACNSNNKPENNIAESHKYLDSTIAKNAAHTALSMFTTRAPDAKLLMGQLSQPIPATGTPSWQFLVGSPKDNTVYAVEVSSGFAHYKPYATVNMKPAEWSKVPTITAWKVDFKEARQKALVIYPQGKKAAYYANFMTYVPEVSKEPSAKPMKWMITFDPKSKGTAPTTTVEVDMVTGAASFAK
jgi:hypothetical protein